jgi:hypothetical protein
MKKAVIIFIFIMATSNVFGQSIEDGLRISNSNGMVTPRVAGLNVAYNGLVDDIGALVYNPAGLAWIGNNELSFGFGFNHIQTDVDFLDYSNDFSVNNAYLSHFGLSVPFKAGKRPAAIGFGYFQESDYENYMKFSGFNANNSLIGWTAANGSRNYDDNLATYLALANADFYTPLRDSLTQFGTVTEEGGMRNLNGSASFEVSDYVSVGVGLSGKFGSYKYYMEYDEVDETNRYHTYQTDYSNIDFKRLLVNDRIDQEISGITGSIGVLAKYEDFFRVSMAIQFPTWYQINETSYREGFVDYDNGDTETNPYEKNYESSYNVTTPFVYRGGISFHAAGITFSTGIEYTDVTQMSFSDGSFRAGDVEALNRQIMEELTGQVTWGFGVEYDIPLVPIVGRASYSKTTSPYGNDIANANRSNFSIGGGVYFGDNIRVDGVFRWQEIAELRQIYGNMDNGAYYIYERKPFSVGMMVTYRY